MTIDERRRLALHEAAKRAWGPEAAVTLMEMLPPSGWGDVATRQDLEQLRVEVRTEMSELRSELRAEMSELRSEMSELRSEVRSELADLRIEVHRALRVSLQWTITTMVAGFAAVSAAVALTR